MAPKAPTNKLAAISSTNRNAKLKADDFPPVELEPVTMSEVGTKLDLGAGLHGTWATPKAARSILDDGRAGRLRSQKTGSATG